ncbi:MAG: aldehyde dehydrogenase [Sphingobacteriia bacterium]|nr:aldehyde dehydrogenase [Sphingobacteriia bacterium]
MQTTLLSQLEACSAFFQSRQTTSYQFRKRQLLLLKQALLQHEEDLYEALYIDLKKSREECWVTENGFVISEINTALKHLKSWMQDEKVGTNLLNMPSSSSIMKEPLGVVLIIGPWNYPLQLLFTPLIGAIAAGNCIVLKPSEFAPATARIMQQIIEEVFPKEYILFVQGDGAAMIGEMMKHFRFDHVFYTGSTAVGKIIYGMAAEKLVPVTLELGGKSPCIIEQDADIAIASKRIAVTKFSNCGQMCVAPDYILVHISQKEKLLEQLKKNILRFFGEDASAHANYGRIINQKQFHRVTGYLNNGQVYYGGHYNENTLYIQPTILTDVSLNSKVMQEEIFGPILPVISFNTMEEALAIVKQHANPLAFYIFTRSHKKEKEWLEAVPAGGACVNNASWHLTNHYLPFGGRGFSGTGNYHGKFSFDTFTHKKAVMKTPNWFDPALKYPPFKGRLGLFKMIVK